MTTPKIRFAGVPSYSDYPSTNRKQKFMKIIFLHFLIYYVSTAKALTFVMWSCGTLSSTPLFDNKVPQLHTTKVKVHRLSRSRTDNYSFCDLENSKLNSHLSAEFHIEVSPMYQLHQKILSVDHACCNYPSPQISLQPWQHSSLLY